NTSIAEIRDRRLEGGDETAPARWRRVAPVEKAVHRDLHPGRRDDAGEGGDVVLVGMHAARRHEPHEVAGAAAALQPGDERLEPAISGDLAGSYRRVDARQVLHHHPPGA